MRTVVVVLIYNRFNNLQKWLDCWPQCETEGAELVIVHNDNGESLKFKAACDKAGVTYIQRNNVGFDFGAYQDICKERLTNFPNDWDYILFCADDTVPLSKDFIWQYLDTIEEDNCGIACMKISPHQALHIRTSGWLISKETSRKLIYPADPITTKKQCYALEHRDKKFMLINQIREMGLDVRQVEPDATAPLFDTGYWRRRNREHEFYETFGGDAKKNDKVVFIATIYKTNPAPIIASMKMQTHTNWELILIHDGKSGDWRFIDTDERIHWIDTPKHAGNWGHANRKWALENLDDLTDASYVVITNSDNYVTPVFCEYMLKGFKKTHTAVATFCDAMVHSYKAWQVIPCRFEKGFIDCGGVMVKREVAAEVGWRDTESHSADWTYFSDIASRYSSKNFIPVKGALLVHN